MIRRPALRQPIDPQLIQRQGQAMDHTSARLGILMLDTRFPRIPGDVGNKATWDFPVTYSIVKGATPHAIVEGNQAPFVEAFVTAGHRMVAQGCTGIATTCGFLSPMRSYLATQLGVPVAASALEQAPQIQGMIPGKKLGVLTISGESLTRVHLDAAHVPVSSIVRGVEHTAFAASILGNKTHLDVDLARRELVAAAREMLEVAPDVGAILLECTNMPPYAADIAGATGVPVFSIVTYLNWFHAGLMPPTHKAPDLREQ